jgi:hypothetical protein
VAIGVPLIVVALAVKAEFRALTWVEGRTPAMNPVQKGSMFLEIATSFVVTADRDEIYFASQTIAQRFDLVSLLAYVIDETPSRVPYWDGESYQALLWKFIPRLLYPEKPVEEMGQTFGHRYGLLDEDDISTSVNMPQLCEMYANFGAPGVVIGMFLLGTFFRILNHSLNHDKLGSWGMVSSATIFSGLINIESNFSLVYGGIIYSTALLCMLGTIIRRRTVVVMREARHAVPLT